MTTPNPTLPMYIGPHMPRWRPTTAADVRQAIDGGLISENHWLDVKHPGALAKTESAGKKVARTLASFANDGGAVIYGVAEDKAARSFNLELFDLAGQPERVDQIARQLCDPPLYVVCHPLLEASDDRGRGLLLVEVPPSAAAPHMVDGQYYGRSDSTSYPLSDSDVARLHAARTSRTTDGAQLIDQEIARDPVPDDSRRRSHLYLVAQPLASPPDLLTDAIETRRIGSLVAAVGGRIPGRVVPEWSRLGGGELRAQGWGSSSNLGAGRVWSPGDRETEKYLVDIEVGDRGSIALMCGRASDRVHSAGSPYVFDELVAHYTRGVVELAGDIGRNYAYGGRWLLAVGVTALLGKYSVTAQNTLGAGGVPFSADRYVESTEAVTAELSGQPGAVTRRLLRRFLRGLGVNGSRYEALLADRDVP